MKIFICLVLLCLVALLILGCGDTGDESLPTFEWRSAAENFEYRPATETRVRLWSSTEDLGTGERTFECNLPDGRNLVRITVGNSDAAIEYGEGYVPDAMTRAFWEGLREGMEALKEQARPSKDGVKL